MRVGFALQLVTARWLGTFLEDPLDVLPGVTTLTRVVASVVTDTTRQLWEELAALPGPVQRRALSPLRDDCVRQPDPPPLRRPPGSRPCQGS